jgi:hypothetical protein
VLLLGFGEEVCCLVDVCLVVYLFVLAVGGSLWPGWSGMVFVGWKEGMRVVFSFALFSV